MQSATETIATFNMCYSRSPYNPKIVEKFIEETGVDIRAYSWGSRFPFLCEYLASLKPKYCFIQELFTEDIESFKKAIGDIYRVVHIAGNARGGICSLCILVKKDEFEEEDLIFKKIEFPEIKNSENVLLLKIPSKKLWLVCCHIPMELTPRLEMTKILYKRALEEEGYTEDQTFVIAGDFNAFRDEKGEEQIKSFLDNAPKNTKYPMETHTQELVTFIPYIYDVMPQSAKDFTQNRIANGQHCNIDCCFFSPNWEVKSVTVRFDKVKINGIEMNISDHAIVLVELNRL
jgi:hypothetical protein